MKNIFMLSIANIRKSKSQAVSLLLFVLIAIMFLNVGLVVVMRLTSFFDDLAEQNHMAHFTAIYSTVMGADSIRQGLEFMNNYPGIAEIETIQTVGGWGSRYVNDVSGVVFAIFSRVDEAQKMDAPSLVGESRALVGDGIYIPYCMYVAGNYEIGDDFKLTVNSVDLYFTIAGTTEEIMLGAQLNTTYRFYISDEKFYELCEIFPDYGITLLSARLMNGEDEVFFHADYNREVSADGLLWDYTYGSAKESRTLVSLIVASIVTGFSVILLFVSMIVIRFRIHNSIEESMTNIGTLKAIGYRNRQIISSIILQFGSIAFVGAVLGITLSQFVIPTLTRVLEPMIALVWKPRFDIVTATISMILAIITVTSISFLSARRINRLHPLIALRGGISTHNFKKNPLPLNKSNGSLNLLLALKQLLQNRKQAIAISLIVAAVTMASIAGVGVNYNLNEKQDNFARSFFGEMFDAFFGLASDDESEAFKERLREHPDVREVFGYKYNGETLLVDEISFTAIIVEDCSLMEGKMLIDGRYPKHSNEIALGRNVLDVAEKKIGDKVTVRNGESEKEYIVTGTIQLINFGGFNGIIAADAYAAIQPDFKFAEYGVYLNEGVDDAAFVEEIQTMEGENLSTVIVLSEEIITSLGGMADIFGVVAIGIVIVTVVVVVLTLYMIIKTIILRRRRELGIQKAIGFTTFQLMNQIALNMTPCILIGVMIGAVAGGFGFNPLIAMFMSSMGVVKVDLPVPVDQMVFICIALIMLAYVVSILIAWRIRKISAYGLVSE